MSWPCPVCEKDFSRKDNLQRHTNRKHDNSNFAPVSHTDVPRKVSAVSIGSSI